MMHCFLMKLWFTCYVDMYEGNLRFCNLHCLNGRHEEHILHCGCDDL